MVTIVLFGFLLIVAIVFVLIRPQKRLDLYWVGFALGVLGGLLSIVLSLLSLCWLFLVFLFLWIEEGGGAEPSDLLFPLAVFLISATGMMGGILFRGPGRVGGILLLMAGIAGMIWGLTFSFSQEGHGGTIVLFYSVVLTAGGVLALASGGKGKQEA
ncbi:MAG: hypothetical protein ABIG98_07345 [Chloroflexota bacterium]